MSRDHELLEKALLRALGGKDAHVDPRHALEGIDWRRAGASPEGTPHTVLQLLNHMIFWQDWTIRWLDGEKPPLPRRASASWPGEASPRGPEDWDHSVRAFLEGLEALKRRCHGEGFFKKRGRWTRLEMLHIVALHNSYHLGQLVLVRRMLEAWPPPSGGDTW